MGDAIAKFNEATERLAEAEKAKAQADEVVAEIMASIETDKKEFEKTITAQTQVTLDRQATAAEKTLKELQVIANARVETYIKEESITRGLQELKNLTDEQRAKFMDVAIQSL